MSKAAGLQSWEQSDFPNVCNTCLGDNPAIRMTKEKFGQECKVCLKPFTVFRWCPGSGCRYRKTEICQTCSQLKNVCQSCIFDLEYGLPVGVRDAVLGVKEKVPQAEVNRDYFMAVNANRLSKGEFGLIKYQNADPASKAVLEDLSKRLNGSKSDDPELDLAAEPIRKRNLPPVCSFYAKGSCRRGEYCPYRHELSAEKAPTLKSYRDRFFGQEDPLAEKLLEKLPEATAAVENKKAGKTGDKSLTALLVSGIRDGIDEDALTAHFSELGPVKSVKISGASAVIEFPNKFVAEEAAKECIGAIEINGIPVRVGWARIKGVAKPKSSSDANAKKAEEAQSQSQPEEKAEEPPKPQEEELEEQPSEPAQPSSKRKSSRAKK